MFDFRYPKLKADEFRVQRDRRLAGLQRRFGETCQLAIRGQCRPTAKLEVAYLIPRSSNNLNKYFPTCRE
jgi:hypothetical protein